MVVLPPHIVAHVVLHTAVTPTEQVSQLSLALTVLLLCLMRLLLSFLVSALSAIHRFPSVAPYPLPSIFDASALAIFTICNIGTLIIKSSASFCDSCTACLPFFSFHPIVSLLPSACFHAALHTRDSPPIRTCLWHAYPIKTPNKKSQPLHTASFSSFHYLSFGSS